MAETVSSRSHPSHIQGSEALASRLAVHLKPSERMPTPSIGLTVSALLLEKSKAHFTWQELYPSPFTLFDRVRVVSLTKPFRGMIGTIAAVEQEGWRLTPFFLYRVELPVGLVSYEYRELQLVWPRSGTGSSLLTRR